MTRVDFGRIHAAHGLIKRLGFHGGVGGNVQLFRAVLLRPGRRPQEKAAAGSPPAEFLLHVQGGEVHVFPAGAEQRRFHRGKALELPVLECGKHRAAGMYRIAQAFR